MLHGSSDMIVIKGSTGKEIPMLLASVFTIHQVFQRTLNGSPNPSQSSEASFYMWKLKFI